MARPHPFRILKTVAIPFLALLAPGPVLSQHTHAPSRAIEFPDVPGYETLVCDLHIHSVFSDGSVWPSIRVEEAIRDGLDCIATTEHLEYQPRKADIPHPDRNRSFEVAKGALRGRDLIVVNGSEITRSMPPGHANAVFVSDANRLLADDPIDSFEEAGRQQAFVFWNHPNWDAQKKDGIASVWPMHRKLIDDGLLHGIEVVNDLTFSEEALQIALDNDLAILGNSDIHDLVDWQFDIPAGGHRPVTLIFASERSEAGILEALRARRTAAWFRNQLIGRPREVLPIVRASAVVTAAKYRADTVILEVTLENRSDAPFLLLNESPYSFHRDADLVVLEPHSTYVLEVKTVTRVETLELPMRVLNVVTAPGENPVVSFPVVVQP